MGDFANTRKAFRSAKSVYDAQPSNFFVIPETRKLTRVTVTFTHVGGQRKQIKVSTRQHEDAAQWTYYPIHVQIPAAGTWRVEVNSGTDRGCFSTDF